MLLLHLITYIFDYIWDFQKLTMDILVLKPNEPICKKEFLNSKF